MRLAPKVQQHIIFGLLFILSNPAIASRLEDVATTTTSMLTNVARGCAVCALMIGAIMMNFGAAETGKRIVIGGLIGCFLAFGGPAIVSTIQEVVR